MRRILRLGISGLISLCLLTVAHGQVPRRIPGSQTTARGAALLGTVRDTNGRAVPGATVTARGPKKTYTAITDGEGTFRILDVIPGNYQISIDAGLRYVAATQNAVTVGNGVRNVEYQLALAELPPMPPAGLSGIPGLGITEAQPDVADNSPYPGLRIPQSMQPLPTEGEPETVIAENANFAPEPYRWDVQYPEYHRYNKRGEFPYVKSHWYDPFNRNRFKGDLPIFGQQWFLNFTGTSVTGTDIRRLPVPSNLGSERPGSQEFFGRGEQAFVDQQFRLSFDLFHGDTSFKPVDFQIKVTPAFDVNFIQTQERGLVNVDVRAGTNRLDSHVGLQEAFVEKKLLDLSPNYDFISVRAGIQQFTSDFRGFIFSDEQPGLRIFGNLRSNRISYNLAYFYMLEKNTNSGLNTFEDRHQQVGVANVYIQDFLTKGYTTEFSFHSNIDQPTIHYDDNGFLVRPAPIGMVVQANGIPVPHRIRAYYLGWTGNGHIDRINVSHAFYQALGHDSSNPIAGREVNINAQFAALELSLDKDWLRYSASIVYSSGDRDRNDGRGHGSVARGFDSIVDNQSFAGSEFSFFDTEGIKLTGSGVMLTPPESLLADLRSNKEEGQANFVNPGIWVYNVGVSADVTTKMRAFANASYLQFDRTEMLQAILFQAPINRNIGPDFGVGVHYRPPLSENIVLTAGVSTLIPGTALRQIYNSRVLLSGFARLKFQF